MAEASRPPPFFSRRLTSYLGFLTRVTHIQGRDVVRSGVQPPLPFPTLSVLIALLDRDGLRQSELATALVVKESNMTPLCKEMAESGLLERRVDPEARRVSSLWLTDKGRALAKDLSRQLALLDREIASVLTDAEYNLLTELLARVFVSRL